MSATIQVIIKGVSMCYQKQVDGKNVWRVLFPFNDCHSVKLSSRQGNTETFLGHFGKAKGTIEIITESATSSTGSTPAFDEQVLDLTSTDTHQEIRAKPGWEKKGALLTIENIVLNTGALLRVARAAGRLDLILTDEKGNQKKKLDKLAYSIDGTIELGETGRVIVKTGATEIFASAPGESCSLTFDNDCDQQRDSSDDRNDMEMIYELIEEPAQPTRKFLVESKRTQGSAKAPGNKAKLVQPFTGTLRFAGDKPCLSVKASSASNLP